MYSFFYHICSIPNNGKYLVRKYIFDEDLKYVNHDDYLFTYKNVNSLLNKLESCQYKKFDTNILNNVDMPNKEDLIKSILTDPSDYTENGQITFERFINGNFSYP
tara:strand:- start:360 stop:674 length:315 start_codon:yes stop_codon:yes gene_type:complete